MNTFRLVLSRFFFSHFRLNLMVFFLVSFLTLIVWLPMNFNNGFLEQATYPMFYIKPIHCGNAWFQQFFFSFKIHNLTLKYSLCHSSQFIHLSTPDYFSHFHLLIHYHDCILSTFVCCANSYVSFSTLVCSICICSLYLLFSFSLSHSNIKTHEYNKKRTIF